MNLASLDNKFPVSLDCLSCYGEKLYQVNFVYTMQLPVCDVLPEFSHGALQLFRSFV